ncbi:MAG: PQQ-binding-like beta-propeller repeat protein [Castellaniella sp.]|uniref:Vgb family protein n=1 Tax=Castellaniella sp. TaxID=1955812 RepID=UPI003C729C7E
MKTSSANIIREYGPFDGVDQVHGLTFDGRHVWFATGEALRALDTQDGSVRRSLQVAARAGTAFDGRHLFQIADGRIQKIDPETGDVLSSIPTPSEGCTGLAWAEGSLWVGQYQDGKILRIDPETGAILRAIESSRYITGVTWADGDLWHGTWADGTSDLRRVDPDTGEVLEIVAMPPGTGVSGLESDGQGRLFCGGGASSGAIRVVARPG